MAAYACALNRTCSTQLAFAHSQWKERRPCTSCSSAPCSMRSLICRKISSLRAARCSASTIVPPRQRLQQGASLGKSGFSPRASLPRLGLRTPGAPSCLPPAQLLRFLVCDVQLPHGLARVTQGGLNRALAVGDPPARSCPAP